MKELIKKHLYKINSKTNELLHIGELIKDPYSWDNLFYQPEAFIYRVDDTHHSEIDKTKMNSYLPGFYILEHEITRVEVKLFWPDCHEVFHPLVMNTNEVVGLRYGYTGVITYYDQFLI